MYRVISVIAAALLGASAFAQTAAPAATPAAKTDAPAAKADAAPAKKDASGNVAVVNGKAIKVAELERFLRQIKQPDSPDVREKIREALIQRELLMQEAKRRKITDREDVQFQIERNNDNVVFNALLRDELDQHKITDEQIQAEYDREKKMAGEKEYKVHHILVDSEDQAKDIIAKLDKGAKFEDLAKGTKDVTSAANGGEMDWASPAVYVKPFSEAMVKLEKGKYTSAPVHTQFGFHVIRLDDVRDMQPPPLEQVKKQIVEALQQKQAMEFIDTLKKKATIK